MRAPEPHGNVDRHDRPAAWRFGGWFDRALMGFSVLGFSVPVFVIGSACATLM
jgi:ABC-type dipeptide/oligopeptide/nickel transport system permease component